MIRSVFIIDSENPLQQLLPSEQCTLLREDLHGAPVIHNARRALTTGALPWHWSLCHSLLACCHGGRHSRSLEMGAPSSHTPIHFMVTYSEALHFLGNPWNHRTWKFQTVQACQDFPRAVDFLAGALWTFRATGMIDIMQGSSSTLRKYNMERLPRQQAWWRSTSQHCFQTSLRPTRLLPERREDVLYYLLLLFVCIKRFHLHG